VFADESAAYGDAFAAMKAGRYDEAAQGFQVYLAKYPRGPKADNATYWLGEAQYMQQDFEGALKSFPGRQFVSGIATPGRRDAAGGGIASTS
jgi:TolA-binding protein